MSYRVHSSNLHNHIKYYRELRGLTQTDLGKLVGLSKASISKLENQCNGTTAYVAYLLCVVLNVSFTDLFYLSI